ncbi:hypothetical protein GP486_005243, partial [Trichoglossum hirsutum]
IADVGKRSDDFATALSVSDRGLAIRDAKDKKSLTKRAEALDIWNRLTDAEKVQTGRTKVWALHGDKSANYGSTYCFGCVIVVVSSGQKLIMAHLPEESGASHNFREDEAFVRNIWEPLHRILSENAKELGTSPRALIFGPTVVPGGDFSNKDKIEDLAGTIKTVSPNANVAYYVYNKEIGVNESILNVKGKVTASQAFTRSLISTMEHYTVDGLLGAAEEACRAGHLQEAQSLLDQWWSISGLKSVVFQAVPLPSSLDPHDARQSKLENVAEKGHSFLVSFLLKQGAEITNSVITAAGDGESTEVFQALLDHGWDINEQYWGTTSLSSILKSSKLTDWHLEHGADPNLHSGRGGTPLERAATGGSVHVVKSLVSHGARLEESDALIAAAASMNGSPEQIKIMSYLLDNGIDINRSERVREPDAATLLTGTALHQAVNRGIAERVRFLLQRGASRDIKGFRGLTALEAAEAKGLSEMAEILRNE